VRNSVSICSWQEHAEYDLPAVINYIINMTKQEQIVYIGHSQGTLIANALFSVDQFTAAKVKLFVALAPIAKVAHVRGLLGTLAPLITVNVRQVCKHCVMLLASTFTYSILIECSSNRADITPYVIFICIYTRLSE
jgi:predicted alpha/beta hydrolase